MSTADLDRFRTVRATGLCCIENGVNIDKFANAGSADPVKAMICLGRLATNKRLDLLISWFGELRQIDPDWFLTIAGRPWDHDERELLHTIRTSGQQDAVSVQVSPSDDDVRALMARASFLVSSSEYEGFGLAAIEGFQLGCIPFSPTSPPFARWSIEPPWERS